MKTVCSVNRVMTCIQKNVFITHRVLIPNDGFELGEGATE